MLIDFPSVKTISLKNFKHDVIKRFYRDWYRPDLMAVLVVGGY
jgi:zinc protease